MIAKRKGGAREESIQARGSLDPPSKEEESVQTRGVEFLSLSSHSPTR